MNDILDDFQIKEKPIKSRFSKFSFGFAVLTMLLSGIAYYSFVDFKNTTLLPSKYIIYMDYFVYLSGGILLSCIIGVVFSIFSYLRAEPANFYKIAGALLNFFLFSLILMGIYFSRFL